MRRGGCRTGDQSTEGHAAQVQAAPPSVCRRARSGRHQGGVGPSATSTAAASRVKSPASRRSRSWLASRRRNCWTSPSWLAGSTPGGHDAAVPVDGLDARSRRGTAEPGRARVHLRRPSAGRAAARGAGPPLPRSRARAPRCSVSLAGTMPPISVSHRPGSLALASERCCTHWCASRVQPTRCTARVGIPSGRTTARSTLPSTRPSGVGHRQLLVAPDMRQAGIAQRRGQHGERRREDRRHRTRYPRSNGTSNWARLRRGGLQCRDQRRLHRAELGVVPPQPGARPCAEAAPAAPAARPATARAAAAPSQREDGAAGGLARFQVAVRLLHLRPAGSAGRCGSSPGRW